MTEEKNLIKQIDDFLLHLSPQCKHVVGVMRLERGILVDEVKRLRKENEDLNNRLKQKR